MLWVKAFHVIFMVTWFAGLFYLPRLFVYHAMTDDPAGRERFKTMERKLYYGIMTPGAILTIAFGIWLLFAYAWSAWHSTGWLHAKLVLAALLVGYHLWCGRLVADFARDRNRHGHRWYRIFNEVPVLFLVAMVILVVVKPF
ncbi:MAG: protoporphyrinogen oxidase HemJ [Gammaproteobacteria bacterium]|jgi:putative membrane protein